jgi:hypothetical protein
MMHIIEVYIMWNYYILIILAIFLIVMWLRLNVTFEYFETHYPGYNATLQYSNTSDKVWDRHPVQTTVLNDMKFKFEKAYNYELENDAYLKSLYNTFKITQTCLKDQEWGVVEPNNRTLPSNVVSAYENAILYITNMIKVSEFFKLPDNQKLSLNPIQVVHDRLISYKQHKQNPSCILNIEAVLYREAKYHAKHVGFTVLAERSKGGWNIKVIDAVINGVVFEDQIGLFPVTGNDPMNTNIDLSTPMFPNARNADFDDDIQFYEFCSSTAIDENKRKACIDVIQNAAAKINPNTLKALAGKTTNPLQ